jgi:hypothetical protein
MKTFPVRFMNHTHNSIAEKRKNLQPLKVSLFLVSLDDADKP